MYLILVIWWKKTGLLHFLLYCSFSMHKQNKVRTHEMTTQRMRNVSMLKMNQLCCMERRHQQWDYLDVDTEILLSFIIISEMLVFHGNHFVPIHKNVFTCEQNFMHSILNFRLKLSPGKSRSYFFFFFFYMPT
jgi:hypothetical protein